MASIDPTSLLDAAPLALLFHVNSKLNAATQADLAEAIAEFSSDIDELRRSISAEKTYPTMERIDLKRHARAPAQSPRLIDVLAHRRTVREFLQAPVPLSLLAALFEHACGVTGRQSVESNDGLAQSLRASPSGGALYPIETYLVAVSVDGLAPGTYHYQPAAHALETVKLGSLRSEFAEVLVTDPGPAFSAPALIVLTARWQRTLSKYHERGYRILLLDAGHLAQNILLMTAALDLGACPLGGFFDDRLGELLHLDPVAEPVLYAIMIGQPAH